MLIYRPSIPEMVKDMVRLLEKRCRRWMSVVSVAVAAMLVGGAASAGQATLAVAANMLPTARVLISAFEEESDHDITLVQGSTGRLYAQIVASAPFDIFLAADALRPDLLEQAGLTAERRAYALGRLIAVSVPGGLVGDLTTALQDHRIALADPALAPYGVASMQALAALGAVPDSFRVVLGDSVGQVAGFFATGNIDLAFLALSQLPELQSKRPLDYVLIDSTLHDPIVQEGVLLQRAAGNPAALAFWAWLKGARAAGFLSVAGYGIPD